MQRFKYIFPYAQIWLNCIKIIHEIHFVKQLKPIILYFCVKIRYIRAIKAMRKNSILISEHHCAMRRHTTKLCIIVQWDALSKYYYHHHYGANA